MKNFLTEKMLFNAPHGSKCTLEVCTPGEPDNDELIFTGTAADCLRKAMSHSFPMTGNGDYFSLTTNRDNYCGQTFEDLCWQMGYVPDVVFEMLNAKTSLNDQIKSAEAMQPGNTAVHNPSKEPVR